MQHMRQLRPRIKKGKGCAGHGRLNSPCSNPLHSTSHSTIPTPPFTKTLPNHVPPPPPPRRHPLSRTPPRRPSSPALLPHPLHFQTRHGQSRRHARCLPLRSARRYIFYKGDWCGDVCCFGGGGGAGDEGGGGGVVGGVVVDGGVESMEDADSVLATRCQYGIGNCYMDSVIEDNRSAFRPYRQTLQRRAAACVSLAQLFHDTSILGLAQIGRC
ncbi:hypothetical protein BDR22DRAFT_484425 [Usnea florida]